MNPDYQSEILTAIGIDQWRLRDMEEPEPTVFVENTNKVVRSTSDNSTTINIQEKLAALKKATNIPMGLKNGNVSDCASSRLENNDNQQSSSSDTLSDDTSTESVIKHCQQCELSCGNAFFGTGSQSADLLIVSERVSGELGNLSAFSLEANQLFQKIMQAVDLKSTFITTIVKCPINEKSQLSNSKTCVTHLKNQIIDIKPSVILCLGAVASQALLQKTSPIGQLRTYKHSFNDIPVIVTFHPDYLLRQPSRKKLVWQDFLKLSNLLKNKGAN